MKSDVVGFEHCEKFSTLYSLQKDRKRVHFKILEIYNEVTMRWVLGFDWMTLEAFCFLFYLPNTLNRFSPCKIFG